MPARATTKTIGQNRGVIGGKGEGTDRAASRTALTASKEATRKKEVYHAKGRID